MWGLLCFTFKNLNGKRRCSELCFKRQNPKFVLKLDKNPIPKNILKFRAGPISRDFKKRICYDGCKKIPLLMQIPKKSQLTLVKKYI
jgi:hypothetical protein